MSVYKITRVGKRSLAVVIPQNILKTLSWRERQRVLVKRVPRGFMVLDAMTKKRKN